MRKSGKVSSRSDRAIAARIKSQMDLRHWDQKDLAAQLGLSEGYISRILSGERPWPINLIFRCAQAFGVPVSDLDPDLEAVLKSDLEQLELRRDVPQVSVLHTFVKQLPRITDPNDLKALVQVLQAFGDRMYPEQ